MADREAQLEQVRLAIIADMHALAEDFGEEYAGDVAVKIDLLKGASNLSEIANVCQNSAWDIAQFVGIVLTTLGFEPQDINDTWLNAHAYGWDT